jgi:GNAT superfamily N-acetyltransferase
VKEHRGGVRELASLAVAPEWRGRGVGEAVIRWLMREDGPPLWLMCRSGLVRFNLKFGFSEVGLDEPQPSYFRRMRALAKALVFAGREDYLAIMCWRAE